MHPKSARSLIVRKLNENNCHIQTIKSDFSVYKGIQITWQIQLIDLKPCMYSQTSSWYAGGSDKPLAISLRPV